MSLLAFGDSITYGFYDHGLVPPSLPDPLVDGYAARLAATLGLAIDNRSYPGSTMNGGEGTFPAHSILAQIQTYAVPTRYELMVTMLGTNDLLQHGTDPTALAAFSASLRQGLLYLTARRRGPEPQTPRELVLARQHRLSSTSDGCMVVVGNTPRQSVYDAPGSAAARDAYAAQVAVDVAYVAGQGRRVYLVDVAAAYDPATQGGDPPNNVHPNAAGHASITAAYLAVIRAQLRAAA